MAIDKYALKNGKCKYRATTYINGKRVQKRGFKTKRDAQKWIDHVRVEGRVNKPITVDALIDEYLQYYRPTVRPSTYKNVSRTLKFAYKYFDGRRVDAITLADAQGYVNEVSARYASAVGYVKNIKAAFEYARKMHYIKENVFRDTKPCREVKQAPEPHRMWTEGELNRFLMACQHSDNAMYYPLFRLLAYTGMRRGELLALDWGDLDGDMLTINKTLTLDKEGHHVIGMAPKTEASNRVIALDAETVRVLNDYKKLANTSVMFPISDRTLYSYLHKMADAAGIPYTNPHNLRHLHCTMLLNAGAQIKDVQERLGHGNPSITMSIYAHANENKHAAIDKLTQHIYTNHYTEENNGSTID